MKPLICITAGDLAGIGPEIISKTIKKNSRIFEFVRILIIGPQKLIDHHFEQYSDIHMSEINVVESPDDATHSINLMDLGSNDLKEVEAGKISIKCGHWSHQYVLAAINMALGGKVAAIVTAPINKTAWEKAGIKHGGHTELLAEMSSTQEYAMGFYSKNLKVILETIHIPLRDVANSISTGSILSKIKLANKFLKQLKIDPARICVAGLNPHAGENELIGSEEVDIIAPAITEAQKIGINVKGPYPADTAFYLTYQENKFDLIVSMYHDQALAPLKMVALHDAVNITLGLPFVRTSPDHGTAYNIAGKGIANPQSMHEAIMLAAKLLR